MTISVNASSRCSDKEVKLNSKNNAQFNQYLLKFFLTKVTII